MNSSFRSEVLENGYTIVRNALSDDEVKRLRTTLLDYFKMGDYIYADEGKAKPDAFNANGLDDILWLLKKETIVNAVKDIVGGDVRYCHHSDVQFNMMSQWHKDNSKYHSLDVWSKIEDGEVYGVYKVGIYLQDHCGKNRNDYSLKVRRASHLLSTLDEGDPVTIYTKANDAIIFDCRITHFGQEDVVQQKRVGRFLKKCLLPFGQSPELRFNLLRLYRRLTGIPDRLSIFYTFGRCNRFTEEHIAGNVRRQNLQNGVVSLQIKPEVLANLKAVDFLY